MIDRVVSKGGIAIRLTDERWTHITEEHYELALEAGKHLVVVYREQTGDGFIITAFLTRRIRSLEKRRQVWP